MYRNVDFGILFFRLSTGILVFLHGFGKISQGVLPIQNIINLLEKKDLPGFIAYGVIVGEIVAPLMLILGIRTKVAAYILAFNCVVAIFLAHNAVIFKLNEFGGWELELLGMYLFSAFGLMFTGGGKYAICSKTQWD